MRVASVCVEAGRNIRSGTTRAFVYAAALALGCGFLAIADGLAVANMAAEATRFRTSGATTYVLTAEASINGAACERLAGTDSIRAAGALRSTPTPLTVTPLPSAPLPLKEASPRFIDLLEMERNSQGGIGVFIPSDLASSLNVGPKDALPSESRPAVSGVFRYPDDGRAPTLQHTALATIPSYNDFDECWAEIWPPSATSIQLLRTALVSSVDKDVKISLSQLNTRFGEPTDPSSTFKQRSTRHVPYGCLVLGLAIGLLSSRLRKLEYASALHAGVSKAAQLLQAALEASVWAAAAIVIYGPIAYHASLGATTEVQPSVFALQLRWMSVGAISAVFGSLIGVAIVRESHLFRYFKNR